MQIGATWGQRTDPAVIPFCCAARMQTVRSSFSLGLPTAYQLWNAENSRNAIGRYHESPSNDERNIDLGLMCIHYDQPTALRRRGNDVATGETQSGVVVRAKVQNAFKNHVIGTISCFDCS